MPSAALGLKNWPIPLIICKENLCLSVVLGSGQSNDINDAKLNQKGDGSHLFFLKESQGHDALLHVVADVVDSLWHLPPFQPSIIGG